MASRLIRVIALPLALALACGQSAGPPERETLRVLLIGNSLTYFNDLPGMVQGLSASAGLEWDVHSVTIGGASLDDHIQNGTAVQLLASGHWDVVIMQQGPSTLPESRVNLRQGVAAFRPLIEAAGGRVAMYEVWPDSTYSANQFVSDFDRLRDSYALAARDVNGLFLPAGEAWRTAWSSYPQFTFYGPDEFHPTAEGSYLAALTIVAGVSGKSMVGVTRRLTNSTGQTLINLQPGAALQLQQAADLAVKNFKNYQPVDQP
jgi:lysophospholipase L1-like esterase